jgi:predicted DNA-binding protein
MARDDPQTNLRLPAELKQRLMDAARDSNRTFGAEVVKRLQESFEVERLLPEGLDAVEARAKKQAESLERMNAKLDDLWKLIEAGPPSARMRPKK